QALEKLQLVLVWVNKENAPLQLAGLNRTFPAHNKPVKMVFETFGKSEANLLDAATYRPSITNGLGFLEQRDAGTLACTPAGELLAAAFDKRATSSTKYRWLADVQALEVRRSDVFKLNEVLDVRSASQAEQTAFLLQFFPSGKRRD